MSKYYTMGNVKVRKFDINDYLKNDSDIQQFLDIVALENDPEYFVSVVNELARKKGMSKVAEETGLARESLYKSLSENGNPSFYSIYKILRTLGLTLSIKRV